MRWSLKELYPSFSSEEYQNDLVSFKKLIEEINEWTETNLSEVTNEKEKLEKYILYSQEANRLGVKLMVFASLTNAVDSSNNEALNYLNKVNVMTNDLTKPNVLFQNFLKEINDLDKIISSSELLEEHRFFVESTKERSMYLLSEVEEVLISKLTTTGSTAWSNLQNKISSTLLVDIEVDGEKKQLPLPVVRNLAYNKDPITRKTAYEAELTAYKKIEESSAAALNGIKGEVITLAKMRGFESPLQEVLVKSRMDKETLDAMLMAMEEYLPVFHKYFKRKGEILGHENGLPFYDMFAPVGSMDKEFTYEEAMNYIIGNFRTFSDKLANYTQNAFDNAWLDVEPRDGKRGGAFCSNIHPIGESRIMSNFNGSFSNMTTLAHELGHGYHGLNLRDESILNSRYPMPIAETASIFCETIVVNAALNEASEEEAFAILEESLSAAGQVIVDIFSRYLFETELFARREDHPLSVGELKEIMIEAQKKAYGDGLDHTNLHPYMWVNKPHYYSAGLNFYNFPYAFGLLFAKGLYAKYLENKEEFLNNYDDLLNATGKNSIKDVAMKMGVDVHDPEFFRSSLRLIEMDVEKFLEISK